MKVRSFIEGTQRGYAYGLKKGNKTLIEFYVHCTSLNDKEIDKAYQEASNGAYSLLSTFKRSPRLIRRSGNWLGNKPNLRN